MNKGICFLLVFVVFLISPAQAKQNMAGALDTALNNAVVQSDKKQQKLNAAFNEAVSNNDLQRMQKLLASGAQANSSQGTKALINACVNKDANMMQQLLSAGASAANTKEGIDALIKASLSGNKEGVENLLSVGVDINGIGLHNDIRDLRPRCGTALIWNVYNGKTSMMKFLLEKGADVHINACGSTALSVAAKSPYKMDIKAGIINMLIPHVADARAAGADKAAFLTVAQWEIFVPIFDLLERDAVDMTGVSKEFRGTLLTELLGYGTGVPNLTQKVSFLIKKGVDVKVMDTQGDTALGLAISSLSGQERMQVTDLLLSAGALKGVDQKTADYTWEILAETKEYVSEDDKPWLLSIEQRIQQEIGPQRI